jgi:hypothetical protein
MSETTAPMDWEYTISDDDLMRIKMKLDNAKSNEEKKFWSNLYHECVVLMGKKNIN